MDPSELIRIVDALPRLEVGVGDGGEAALVAPEEVGDVGHGDGDEEPAGADAEGEGHGGAQEDVAVPRDDAAGHGGDEHVDEARHQLLARLARGGQRGDGRGEGALEVEGRVDRAVHGVLGAGRVVVQEHPGFPYFDG